MHDNIVIGIHSEEICTFLREQKKNYIEVLERVECYILPNDKALRAICKAIDSAKKEICIAIFTFTHQEIVENLKAAHNRGVRVTVAIEKTTAFGASKKIVDDLEKSGITVKISEGLQLLHHKWIWIDETTLIVGSANLTRSAFEKNCDCVLLIHSLTKKEQNVIKKIWRKLLSHPLIGTIYL